VKSSKPFTFGNTSYMQGRSQLKTNPGALSIKYQGIYTITKEIHGKVEVDISNFWFYRGARAPRKANVASPLHRLVRVVMHDHYD